MVDDRRPSRHPLSGNLVSSGVALTLETAALRLVYPAAIVLVEQAWAGMAVTLTIASIALSLLRGWSTDRVTRIIRANLFDSVSEAIACYPALAPPGAPPVGQLESEIARGVPWIESLIGVTGPAILGNALALPVIAFLSWIRIGTLATLIASAAIVVGIVVGAVVARQVGSLGDAAWNGYQPIARLIENGFRGRVELGIHGRSAAHRERLLSEVAKWSRAERRAFVWGGVAGWSAPAATALTAVVLTRLLGVDPFGLLQQIVREPSRSFVVAGLLALSALPVLSALSRGFAQWSTAWPHFRALERFIHSSPRSALQRNPSEIPSRAPLGAIRAERVRFTYPVGRSREPPSVVEADLIWEEKETLAISGANGCGKTTLTWLLMGIIDPEAGAIGVDINNATHPPAALAGRIAYLPQHPYFDELETVREAIRFVAPDTPDAEIEDLISELLGGHLAGGARAILERTVLSLSTGQRRAVSLARVLLRGSDLVILDEPEANLDGELRQRVMSALRRVKSSCRMLIVTHDEAFAAIADRVYRMPSRNPQVETLARPTPLPARFAG
jgi:ABC-type multidrug transport system fused ATPase/permease subunit